MVKEESSSASATLEYLQGIIPVPGRNLLEEVSSPFCSNGREFQYNSCETAKSYQAVIKALSCQSIQHRPLGRLRLNGLEAGFSGRVSLSAQNSLEPDHPGLV